MLTRVEVRRALEVSASTTMQMQRDGRLNPTIINGVAYFARDEVARLKERRAQEKLLATPASVGRGEIASMAFAKLAKGEGPTQLVIDLKIEPAHARELLENYLELRQLSKTDGPRCARCNTNAARFCGGCVTASAPQSEPEPESQAASGVRTDRTTRAHHA